MEIDNIRHHENVTPNMQMTYSVIVPVSQTEIEMKLERHHAHHHFGVQAFSAPAEDSERSPRPVEGTEVVTGVSGVVQFEVQAAVNAFNFEPIPNPDFDLSAAQTPSASIPAQRVKATMTAPITGAVYWAIVVSSAKN